VHKQQLPKPPVPPEAILPWIDQQALKQAADDMPSVHAELFRIELFAYHGWMPIYRQVPSRSQFCREKPTPVVDES
jgi:hypothetical protein